MPGLEEGHIAALIVAQAQDLGGGGGGVNIRWSSRPRPGVWIATVAEGRKHKHWRATGGTPLRALVSLEIVVQAAARRHRGKEDER